MAIAYKPTGMATTIPAGILIGSGAAMFWTIGASVILAKLIETEVFPENAVGYGSMVILLTASALAAVTAWRKIKRQRAMVCLVSGGVYFLMLAAMTALFFGGQFQAVGVTAGLVLAGSGSVVLMGLRGPGRKKYRT